MTEEQKQLGFREWIDHYEREQESDRDKVNVLTEAVANINSNVGALTANVRTLMDNQKSMYSRINRPANWGIFATFAGVIFMVVGLITTGIKDDIDHLERQAAIETERNLDLHIWFRNAQDENSMMATENKVDLQWIKMLEARVNNRTHGYRE